MQFTKLKITGFKSFVEPIEFPVEPGMTGIVGPNGCGKSNVVESLRWAMGENSAKRLRGGEMDDVIFAGSAGRPARNIAEVALVLDNKDRTALAEFNSDDEIEVTRKIERGLGSDYYINSRPVRQKDVQLLFADQATGAHSTSIVSQGKVSSLIAAKPEERRQVLEEAAGVSGLHSRRHEAELKLKGAEANLARVGDQLQTMDQQLRGLKTQVRQTSRYRNLGELIRKAEAGVLNFKSVEARKNLITAEASFNDAEGKVRDLTSTSAQAATAMTESAATLPPLRQAEAAASAVVQRLYLERETLEREARRLKEAQESLGRRIEEVKSDAAREEKLAEEARNALVSLNAEQEEAQAKLTALEADAPELESRTAQARLAAEAQEKIFQEKTARFAEISAKRSALEEEVEALAARHGAMKARIDDIQKQSDEAQAASRSEDPSRTQGLIMGAEAALQSAQTEAQDAQEARRTAEETLSAARAARDSVNSEKTKIEAEIAALRALLHSGEAGTPLADQLTVEKGYEAALGAALGEGLLSPLDNNAKSFWQDLGSFGMFGPSPLPRGATPLLNTIQAPSALKRALSHVGVVESFEEGERLAAELKPGQILVTRDGDSWRWDGFTQRKDAETPAAARLKQRARLTENEGSLQNVLPRAEQADSAMQAAMSAANAAQTRVSESGTALQQAFDGLHSARQQHTQQAARRAESDAKIAALGDQLTNLHIDEDALRAEQQIRTATRDALPNVGSLQQDMDAARQALAEQRAKLIEIEAAQTSFTASRSALQNRLKTAMESIRSWQARNETGARHLEALTLRLQTLQGEATELAARPAAIEEERQALLTKSEGAEETRRTAADALVEAEQKQSILERASKTADEALMQGKESRVRFEEQMYRARGGAEELALRIREHWHCAPEELAEKAGLDPEESASLDALEQELAKYNREREGMGPVNLRAEIEAEEIQGAMDKISADKNDLEGAIAKLRQGISTLNREARERLETAFTEVDKNFGEMFTRLFGGGKAHLKLIESDDPLQAGLEIFAQPPGKRLQALSLLSGGEQALTAVSLLFAIFMVNPSPICVLDEVDAPLDEANVDRFCTLLREMAEGGKTRFLVITHHRLTMARMDRLFGVTMAEKGVSQLVSVDLKQALAIREQGNHAPAASYKEAAA